MKVLVVDDEALARRGVRQLAAAHADLEIVGECRTGREALRALEEKSVDVVFLDIQMPELGGFDVVRSLLDTRGAAAMPSIVFLTAYEEFALDAFEVEAVDYLLKPVSQERFDAALSRVRRRMSPEHGAKEEVRHVVVHGTSGKRVIPVSEIQWIGADDYYAVVYTAGKRHLLRETMSSLEGRLEETQFMRVHRGAIVNLAAVRELRREDGEVTVVLNSGQKIPVSRRRRAMLAQRLQQ